MFKHRPSFDNTWARPPAAHSHRSSSSPSTRQTLLPYGPTPISRPTTSAYRSSSSTQLRTVVQQESNRNHSTENPPLSIATFQWMRGELIGQGSYGKVFMALNANTGELMAVKQVELTRQNHKPAHHDALRFLAFESETLRELDHPNIVQYLGCESSAEALSVFLEYVPGGTIGTLLQKFGRFRQEVTKSFTQQILEGLDYLHANGIIHRDLKPDNILVEPTGVCKISDFGISKRVDDIHSPRAHTLMRGTVQYMAPELLGSKEKGYDGKIDIWSVGCMVMEMWTGEKPWGTAEHFLTILVKLGSTQSPPPLPIQLEKSLPPDAHNFRKSCFHMNPIQRPTAAELKQHPYLRLPPTWVFNATEIPHPSREKRLPIITQKIWERKRDRQDDGATYRPGWHPAESRDATLREQDIFNNPTLETIRPPIPRGPSPPIVIIKPVRLTKFSSRSSSPVEPPEQDNSTSGSSNTSSSRWSSKPKRKYRVVNPQEENVVPYVYSPPPLPPTSQPYSSRLGTSSKYRVDYTPEPFSNPSSQTRSSRITLVQGHDSPASHSATDLTHSHSPSQLSRSPSLQSSRIDDDATWKRPPATEFLQYSTGLTPFNTRDDRRRENDLEISVGTHQLRTPSVPIASPPLPPTPPPSTSLTSPPNSFPSATQFLSKPERSTACYQPGNRPDAHDIVRDLGFYFPDHDLDRPMMAATSSVGELAEDFSALNGVCNREDNDAYDLSHISLQPAASGSSDRFPQFRSPSSVSLSHNLVKLDPSNATSFPSTHIHQHNQVWDKSNNIARSNCTKSIRRIVQERECKRLSHPGKIHRRTLWDFKMEELPGLHSSTQPPNSDEDSQ